MSAYKTKAQDKLAAAQRATEPALHAALVGEAQVHALLYIAELLEKSEIGQQVQVQMEKESVRRLEHMLRMAEALGYSDAYGTDHGKA